jgi:hypothetical protein
MVGLKKSKQSILFSLLHDDKTENKSLQSIKDHPMIVLNTTTKHSEPVFLNVYDLLSDYRTTHCLLTYCSCHHLGVYRTVSLKCKFLFIISHFMSRVYKYMMLNIIMVMVFVHVNLILILVD